MSSKKNKKVLKTTLGKAPSDSHQQEVDLSHLGKPVATSINGLRHVLSLVQTATSEVKRYITYECDIMYECRICRSIFRSLANFVLHKREYCRDVYNPLDHTNCRNMCQENEYYVKQPDEDLHSDRQKNSDVQPQVENKKSMTSVLKKLLEKQENNKIVEEVLHEDISNESNKTPENKDKANDVALESIETTNTAVFQTMFKNMIQEHNKMDFMKNEVMELHGIFSSDEAVIGPDGKILQFETEKKNAKECVPKNNLVCTVCSQKFSTRKTLTYHIKYKHNDSRMVYPCPVCTDQFANAWCVFRHLYKIHRKSTTQIRKMRDQVHANAFRKDQAPLKKKTVSTSATSETQMSDNSENQWMENIEGDNDLQMCGGCGRRFERKAALHSHSQLCTKRIAICNTIKGNSSKQALEEKQEAKINKTVKCAKIVTELSVQGAEKRKPLIIRRKCDHSEKRKSSTEVDNNNTDCLQTFEDIRTSSNKLNTTDVDTVEASASSTEFTKTTSPEVEDSLADEMQFPEMTEVLNIIGVVPLANQRSTPCIKQTEKKIIDIENKTPVEESVAHIEAASLNNEVIYIEDDSDDEEVHPEKRTNEQHNELNEDIQSTLHDIMLLNNQDNEEEEEIQVKSESDSTNREKRKRSLSAKSYEEDPNESKRINTETSNKTTVTLETKAEKYVDKKSLTCVPCNMQFESNYNLMIHMSKHFNWFCYQCMRCSFMSYFRTTCVLHVHETHHLSVNQVTKNILPIPNWKTLQMSNAFHPLEGIKNHNDKSATSESCSTNVTDIVDTIDLEIITKTDETAIQDSVTDNIDTIDVDAIIKKDETAVEDSVTDNVDAIDVDIITKTDETATQDSVTENIDAFDVDIITNNYETATQDSVTRKMIMEVIFGGNVSTVYSEEPQLTKNGEELNNVYSLRSVCNRNKVAKDNLLHDPKQATKSAPVVVNYSAVLSNENESATSSQISETSGSQESETLHVVRMSKPMKVYLKKASMHSKKEV